MLWFEKLMVRFFMSLDTTLFNFIGTLYDLLIAISRTSILSQGDIASFAARIEILLGIFMLFKVSFSLITYVVNPDDFSDKSKGFGKLIQNSVISLVLIVLVPYIFQMAFSLQAKVLDDNILAKLLLGEKIQGEGDSTILDTAGNRMAFYVMIPFFSPNYSVEGLSECMNMVDENGDFNEACSEALESAGLTSPNLENYTYGIKNKSLGLTFRSATALSVTNDAEDEDTSSDQHFVIDYKKPLSTVTAVVVCLLLISFCIDIGVRSVKLAFLQLIYPIPVISYMDPKSGKDGMFSKWYKMCLSTFLSLFIRLLALYFGIYIITKVADMGMYDIVNGSQITNGWVKIFVIIGVLMFIKQLPKILENMGVKIEGDGKFNLNPLKKLEEGAVGGKAIKKAAIGVGAGGLAGAAAFGSNVLARKGNVFSGIAGAVSGARRGIMSGLKGEKLGKAYSNSYRGAMDARKSRADRKDNDVGWGEMMTSKAQQTLGLHTQGEKAKAKIDALSKITKLKDQATTIADKSDSAVKRLLREKEAISKIDPQSLAKNEGISVDEAIRRQSDMIKSKDDEIDIARAAFFKTQSSDKNSAVSSIFGEMKEIATKYKDEINQGFKNTGASGVTVDSFTIEQIKEAGTAAINAQQSYEQSSGARHAQTVDEYAKKKDQK